MLRTAHHTLYAPMCHAVLRTTLVNSDTHVTPVASEL